MSRRTSHSNKKMPTSGSFTSNQSSKKTDPVPPQTISEQSEVKVVDKRRWARGDDVATEEPILKPSHVQELERQLSEKDAHLQSYIDKYKTATNEFEQARIRLRREVSKDIERGKQAILAELLDVIDNLELAMESAKKTAEQKSVADGIEIILVQFLTKLSGFGVTKLDSLGQKFDPNYHDAVSIVSVTQPSQDNLILGVIKEGYLVGNNEVLRPASVAVGKFTQKIKSDLSKKDSGDSGASAVKSSG